MPGYDVTSWYGLAVPGRHAAARSCEKTNKAMRELLAREAVRDADSQARRAGAHLDA